MTDDLKLTALHEAGHAVAHVRLEIQQGRATIVPDDQNAGAVSAEGVEHVYSAEAATPMVEAYCAGYAALVAAGYSEELAAAGAGNDFANAELLIEQWNLGGDLQHWKLRAVELMGTPANRRAVELVAEHLVAHRTLDGDYLDLLVDLADGSCTEQEFARWLQIRAHCASRGNA